LWCARAEGLRRLHGIVLQPFLLRISQVRKQITYLQRKCVQDLTSLLVYAHGCSRRSLMDELVNRRTKFRQWARPSKLHTQRPENPSTRTSGKSYSELVSQTWPIGPLAKSYDFDLDARDRSNIANITGKAPYHQSNSSVDAISLVRIQISTSWRKI
jgi:hypothetical protein